MTLKIKKRKIKITNNEVQENASKDSYEEERNLNNKNTNKEEASKKNDDTIDKNTSNENANNKCENNEDVKNETTNIETPSISKISVVEPKTITPIDLFKESILDTLELNLTDIPTVTVENRGNHNWEEIIGSNPSNPKSLKQHKLIYFRDKIYDENLDEIITVIFNNCGTLDGRPIDIKFIYSDLHTTADTRDFFLSWCAYGKVEGRLPEDEFFNIGFDRFNLDISFYYHGKKNPIKLDNAYFTVSSLDKNDNHTEATNSMEASNAYYYQNTAIERSNQEIVGGKTYTNVFKGTINDLSLKETRSAVCFEYNNKTSINFNMFSLGTAPVSFGYNVNFYSLNASNSKPVKSVNAEEVYSSETLVYTIKQKMPYINNDGFKFNTFRFKDILASCFDFDSIDLEVKDYNGNNITNSCRKYPNSKWRNNL